MDVWVGAPDCRKNKKYIYCTVLLVKCWQTVLWNSQQPITSHIFCRGSLCMGLSHTTLMWRNWRSKTQPGICTPFLCTRTLTAKWGWFSPALQQHSKTEICLDEDDDGWGWGVWRWEKLSENGERIQALPKTALKFLCKVWDHTLGSLLVLCEWVSVFTRRTCMYACVCVTGCTVCL